MQIKAMQRAAAPIALEFAIADLDGIKSLNQNLIRFALEKDLDARTLGAINGTIANQIRVLIPQQPMQVIQAVQTTMIPTKPDLVKFLENLPLEVKEKIAQDWKDEIVRKLNSGGTGKGEVASVGGPAIPSESSVSPDGVGELASQTDGSHSKNGGESAPPPT